MELGHPAVMFYRGKKNASFSLGYHADGSAPRVTTSTASSSSCPEKCEPSPEQAVTLLSLEKMLCAIPTPCRAEKEAEVATARSLPLLPQGDLSACAVVLWPQP